MKPLLSGLKCLRAIETTKLPKGMYWEQLVLFLDPTREDQKENDIRILKEINPKLAVSE